MITELKLKAIVSELRSRNSEWENVDAKEKLQLSNNTEKAEFAKDVIAMANNNKNGYILIGLKDDGFEVSNSSNHKSISSEQLNQIIAGRIDPLPKIFYQTFKVNNGEIGCIEIVGNEQPYMCIDRYENYKNQGNIYVRQGDTTRKCTSRIMLDHLYSLNKCKIECSFSIQSVEKLNSLGKFVTVKLKNNSNRIAKNIRVHIETLNSVITKCPSKNHSHSTEEKSHVYIEDVTGHSNFTDIGFEHSLIHAYVTQGVLTFWIREAESYRFKVYITGENVKESNEHYIVYN